MRTRITAARRCTNGGAAMLWSFMKGIQVLIVLLLPAAGSSFAQYPGASYTGYPTQPAYSPYQGYSGYAAYPTYPTYQAYQTYPTQPVYQTQPVQPVQSAQRLSSLAATAPLTQEDLANSPISPDLSAPISADLPAPSPPQRPTLLSWTRGDPGLPDSPAPTAQRPTLRGTWVGDAGGKAWGFLSSGPSLLAGLFKGGADGEKAEMGCLDRMPNMMGAFFARAGSGSFQPGGTGFSPSLGTFTSSFPVNMFTPDPVTLQMQFNSTVYTGPNGFAFTPPGAENPPASVHSVLPVTSINLTTPGQTIGLLENPSFSAAVAAAFPGATFVSGTGTFVATPIAGRTTPRRSIFSRTPSSIKFSPGHRDL